MTKKNICTLICVLILLLSGCQKKEYENNFPKVSGNFTITALKVGKADCFVLQTINSTILIDTAESENAKDIVDFLKEKQIKTIDCMIITHFDKDHVGGAASIIKKLEVEKIYQPSYVQESTKEYDKYITAMENKEITPITLKENKKLTIDDLHFEFFACDGEHFQNNDNNCSLVTKIIHGKNSFLFTGDIEKERIDELISSGYDLKANFLKIPHHGIYEDNSKNLIEYVKPSFALITCSEKYPSSAQLENILNKNNIKIYSTLNKPYTFVSDGNEITEKDF